MTASQPNQIAQLFVEFANAGDVDGLVGLYEQDAVLARNGDEPIVGWDAIRNFYRSLLAERPQFALGRQRPALTFSDLALTSTVLADGTVTAEIARRQADGSWRWIVDRPSVQEVG